MTQARERPTEARLTQIGLVVHPTRSIDGPLDALREWADAHSAEVGQIPASCRQREVATSAEAADCELIVSIGGDGTMLAAMRSAVTADRPVLGVACGSLGVLTTVSASSLIEALDRFIGGDWIPRARPALDLRRDEEDLFALNDVAVVRDGPGQVSVAVDVDGIRYAEFAGDGCIVSTPAGSSAYSLAAGGPLLSTDAEAFVLTPLTTHGGACPPLVLSSESRLMLDFAVGHTGARLELDGQLASREVGRLAVSFRSEVATVVGFEDQEPVLTGLRRRRVIMDSPRILARENEEGSRANEHADDDGNEEQP